MKPKGNLRVCENGHTFYKSSDCPICPECEKNQIPKIGFFSRLSGPARRALENANIQNPETLALYSAKEILKLHGIGPSAIPILQSVLWDAGLDFKET